MTQRDQIEHRETTKDRHVTNANCNNDNDTAVRSDRRLPPSTPRWVKIFGIIFLILVMVVVILHLAGIGFGGHGVPGGHTPPASIIEYGVQQP